MFIELDSTESPKMNTEEVGTVYRELFSLVLMEFYDWLLFSLVNKIRN